MPELPEVETVRRSLAPLVGQKFRRTQIIDGRLRYRVAGTLTQKIYGEKLTALTRLGKYLLLEFPSDTLVFHLGMTGRLLIGQNQKSPYAKVIFEFSDDRLDFIDVRRFAFVLSGEAAQKSLPQGVDAIAPWRATEIAARIRMSGATIKAILLDQKIIAGLGNIYVSEILFLAKVHPTRRGITLSADEVGRILKMTRIVLKKAIEAKGSSISDFVYALPGEKEFSTGNYQSQFLVYSRDGEACKVCKSKIQKIVQSGRSTFFCAKCQKG